MVKVRQERIVTPEQQQRHNEISAELAELRTQEWQAWRSRQGFSRESRERQRRVHELENQLADLSKLIRQQAPTQLQEWRRPSIPTGSRSSVIQKLKGAEKVQGKAGDSGLTICVIKPGPK